MPALITEGKHHLHVTKQVCSRLQVKTLIQTEID